MNCTVSVFGQTCTSTQYNQSSPYQSLLFLTNLDDSVAAVRGQLCFGDQWGQISMMMRTSHVFSIFSSFYDSNNAGDVNC